MSDKTKVTNDSVEKKETPEVNEEAVVQAEKTEIDPIEQLTKENSELEDKYLRAQAEIQNMQNRFTNERSQLLKYDGQKLATAILPVLDNLERALENADSENESSLKKGIQMTYDHMQHTLADHDIVEIEALNQKFDPTVHQAVQTVPVEGDQETDTVVQVFQKGYYLKDRVLRPAMVVVAQ